MAWNDLSISQKSYWMNQFRRAGITSLSDMSRAYDTAIGGMQRQDPYLQYAQAPVYANGGDKEKTTTLTDNTGKSWYENTLNYLFGGTRGLIESKYKPTRGDNGEKYYTRKGLKNDVVLNLLGGTDAGALTKIGTPKYYSSLNDAYEHLSKLNNRGLSTTRTAGNATLGAYGVSAGSDSRGRYISFYDTFDYRVLPMIFGDSLHPFQLYDRIYEDEWDSLSKLQANGDPNSGNIFLRPEGGAGGSIYASGGHKFGDGGDEEESSTPYTGEIRQGKKWTAWDNWKADHPMAMHRIRKAGVLLSDAAKLIPGFRVAETLMSPGTMSDYGDMVSRKYGDNIDDSAADRVSGLATPLGAVARAARPIVKTLEQVKPDTPWVTKASTFRDKLIEADRIMNALQFVDDFAKPVEQFKEGGHKIHIKKENRGKFTALKKRTGHSASWFKAHGTPAQKKMAVFALNAKKWKHEYGGIKF